VEQKITGVYASSWVLQLGMRSIGRAGQGTGTGSFTLRLKQMQTKMTDR